MKFLNGSFREVLITPRGVSECTVERDHNNNITSVTYDDLHTISIGDTLNYELNEIEKFISFNVSHFRRESPMVFVAIEEYRNMSTTFLLPILSTSLFKYTEDFYSHIYLINAYLSADPDLLYKYIYLKYRFSPGDTFLQLEKNITSHPLFINHTDSNGFVTYKFRVPEEFQKDVKYFVRGKYSKLSKKLIDLIIKFNTLDKESVVRLALERNEDYILKLQRELDIDFEPKELLDKPKIINEILI